MPGAREQWEMNRYSTENSKASETILHTVMVDTCFKFIQTQRTNNTMSEPLWQWCVRGGSSVETMYHISGRMSTVEKEVHVWGQGIHGYLVFSTQFCYEPKISLKKIKFIKFIKSNHVLFSLESLAQRNKYQQATT